MTFKEIKRIKKTLDTLEAGFLSRAKSLFEGLLPELTPYVEDALRTQNVEGFELPGRKWYIVLFKRYIQELYAQGMATADLELEAMRKQFAVPSSPSPEVPIEAMNWIDRWTKYFGDDYYGDATSDVVRVLKESLGAGLTVDDTMGKLSVYLTDPKYNDARLETIARTNATTAFNQGRLEMFRQAGDFVEYVKFLSIMDSRTTDICRARNGRIMRLDSEELAANTPPLHYMCRSVLSPITRYDLQDMEKAGWKWSEPGIDGKPMGFQDLKNWKNLPELPPGFGDLQERLRPPVITEEPYIDHTPNHNKGLYPVDEFRKHGGFMDETKQLKDAAIERIAGEDVTETSEIYDLETGEYITIQESDKEAQ